jgi:hypothetical protein
MRRLSRVREVRGSRCCPKGVGAKEDAEGTSGTKGKKGVASNSMMIIDLTVNCLCFQASRFASRCHRESEQGVGSLKGLGFCGDCQR